VKTEQIEIHTRLIQQGRYSAIIEAGARIGRTTVVIESDGTATVNGTEYSSSGYLNLGDGFNLQKISNETSTYNWKVGFPEVDGEEFSLSVAAGGGTYPRQDGKQGEHSSYMAFNIHAHVSLFEESEGLCGSWNDDSPSPAGFVDREGDQMTLPPLYPGSFYSYNATALGENWQVDTSQGDSDILSAKTVSDDSWGKDTCVGMDVNTQKRHLALAPTVDCEFCLKIPSIVGTLNCLYDAQVVGCDEAKTYQVYDAESDLYSSGSEADVNLQCLDIARLLKSAKEPKSSKSSKLKSSKLKSSKLKSSKSGKASRNLRSSRKLFKADDKVNKKCENKGGQCVVYCDATSEDYQCKMGLCDVDIEYDTPVDVLNSGKYYTACSCKIPN
jgi:hypothetical protein